METKTLEIGVNIQHSEGGDYEVEYRYKKTSDEKRIWSKGFILTENGHPILIRGIVRDVTV